ncbi:MAG: amino acid adenylation domain-containing protein, partial [Oscillochloris sp.]|nr:amino acid adenylation domain-containing protein [Oscillochloris sp.]
DSLTERFAAQVVASPDALALWALDERLSYRDLDAQAAQLAARLRALGVGAPGQAAFVGLSLPHGREAIVAFWAILRAGGVVVPLDPKYPPDRLAFMVADSAIDVIITARAWVDHLPPSGPTLLLLDVAAQGDSLADAPLPTAPATSFACCLYTSGSTGRPKGVLLEHEALVAHCDAIQAVYQYTPDDRVLLFASLNYVAALEQLLAPLLVGATVIVREPTLWSAVEFPAKVRHYGLTVVDLPPGYWQTLLDAWVRMPGLVADLPLRMVILGGEATTPGLVQRWYQTSLGHIRLLNAYGMTETPVTATLYAIPYAPGRVWERIPIGRPTPQRTAYVLDAQRQPVPQGEVGELYVGGAGLAWGYLNQPELTTARFSTDPFSADPTARLYQTGDLARWLPDGNLEYLGRADDQVQIRGHRIELGEVEAALSSHPAVQVCVVALREVAPGDQQLVAYVVLNEPDADLRSYLYARLPDHMVPSAFVSLDALPLTPNRKVDRKALPAPDFSAVQRDYVAAQTDTERQLAAIWQEVLNLARVGLYDNFFDLGGHSLLAIQAIARINDCYRIELPLRLLFEHPTIAGMAPHVAALRSACPPSPGMPRQVAAAQRALGPRPARLPLSFAQQRLWLMDQLGSGAAYNLPVILALTGSLQLAALQASLDEVVRRHESLRTTFAEQAGVPTQSIQPALSVALPRADLRALPAEARQVEAQRLIHAEAQRPFDLRHDVLLRALLIEIDDQQSVLVLTLHHIASDGWSMGVFMEEITSLYRAHIQGAPSPLPPLPLQYADFALWQRAWLQGARLETQLSYWRTQLAGAPPLLELPFAQPRPSAQRFAGSLVIRWIDTALVRQLRQLGQQASTTLFMTMLSAFQLLLFRYTGQTDLVVGSPIANRQRQEFEPLIGLFVNTLALRARLSPDMSFAELLAQVRQTTLEAYTHQDLPFERLVEELHPERTLAYTPLVQIIFALHNAPAKAWALPGLQAAELPLAEPMVRTDMEVHLWEIDNTIEVQWLYNTALIEPTAIERMATHYQTLLESIVAAPARPISQLPLLTETERQQLLVEWNATAGACQQDQCAHQLFEAQVAQSPDAVAVEHENQQLTYRQLNARANQVAHQLQALGVGPDVLVGLCVERSLDMVVGLLGILKAGGAYVPLDPSYPSERLAFMLEDAAAPVLLTQARLRKQLPPTGAQVVTLDEVLPTQRPSHTPSSPARPEQLAYVIYTSGSTGQPKAALLTHRGLTNATREQIRLYGITAASRVAQAVSFSFDVATGDIFMALCSGASLVLLPPLQQLGGELGDILQAAAISHIQLPSPVLAALPPTDLPALQTIVAGGDVVSAELAQRWGGGRHLYNAYGPTEATIVTTVARCLPTEAAPPIGRPIAHAQLYVLDPAGQPLPVGVPGELYIGGAGVARGYLNRPDLSAARFVSNPFGPGQLYKSGDRVRYRADGNLEFLGRLDQQVKLRGFRIELGEIESQLRTHPAVRDAVVLIREDQPGERHLVAYVTTLAIDVDGEQARVSQWQATADQIETPPLAERDQESKFKGWNCSCTGRAIPSAEMQEWLDHTVADILALQPQRIFEIGCGTGLLLERIAPACELYWGADFSRTALREAQRLTASRPDLRHVTLQQRLADDITDLPSAYFDLIILNSVVQYFPSIDYLLRVL